MTSVRPDHDHDAAGAGQGSPWFRAATPPQAPPQAEPEPMRQEPVQPVAQEWYGEQPAPDAYPSATAPGPAPDAYPSATAPGPAPDAYPSAPVDGSGPGVGGSRPAFVRHDTTMPLPTAETLRITGSEQDGTEGLGGSGVPDASAVSGVPERPTGGRAERRKAAKSRGRRRAGAHAHGPATAATGSAAAGTATATASSATGATAAGGAPMSRVEARRAARAAKDSLGVVASRVVGELFITFGVVMLLFVTYQLWWTNVQAGLEVDKAKSRITEEWASTDRTPDAFEPGQGFAIMYIPKLDVVVPIAEGIDKEKVLDRGMAGHYAEGALKTAMPSDKQGNFAVAGHRNTHGEPFRYINQLRPGDPIVVETRDTYYTYEMASILPQTPPSNISVLKPIPDGSGFDAPGRYITLTTCTPEFTSTYRMIVWGKMVEERPRSKGKPDALVG
ncbi:class E sortase [Streptomyces sp. NPDC047928]|uniref:class E sortase n=1 Tax=unclassified Streptomyces TaxID=2593676 RepID=UPI00371861EA